MRVRDAAQAAVEMATEHNDIVFMRFNDVELLADPGGSVDRIVGEYEKTVATRRAFWDASEAGKAEAARAAEFRIKAAEAEAAGILPFTMKDKEGWAKSLAANTDPYGACGHRYAARWANMMEAEIANGLSVAEAASKTERAADLEGITGFMQSCAASILCQVWEHGDELRKWREAGN